MSLVEILYSRLVKNGLKERSNIVQTFFTPQNSVQEAVVDDEIKKSFNGSWSLDPSRLDEIFEVTEALVHEFDISSIAKNYEGILFEYRTSTGKIFFDSDYSYSMALQQELDRLGPARELYAHLMGDFKQQASDAFQPYLENFNSDHKGSDIEINGPDNEGYSWIDVTVISKLGLHPRELSKLINAANQYEEAMILLGPIGKSGDVANPANVKSILQMMTLQSSEGSRLRLKANGPEASDVVRHLYDAGVTMWKYTTDA